MQNHSLIALIPAYEPNDQLIGLTRSLCEAGLSVLIVDDGSGDAYRPVFQALRSDAIVLQHKINRGKGCALKTGYDYIRNFCPSCAAVLTLDADGQHLLGDALRVLETAVEHPGTLVLGSRSFTGSIPARSRFGNALTRTVFRASTGSAVRDTQTGLRAFGRGLLPLMLEIPGDRYEYEMNVLLECARKKVPVLEIPIQTVYLNDNESSHFHAVRDSARIYGEILKFAGSSLLGFAVDYSLYSILAVATAGLGMAVSIPLSNVTARVVSASVNYSVNRRLVFRSEAGGVKSAAQYFSLAACILLGNTVLLSFLIQTFRMNPYLAKILTELTFFAASWTVQRFLIFRKPQIKRGKATT